MFRIALFISILVLIFVSVGGYIASYAGWLSDNLTLLYNTYFSFITGIASVIGLLAFASSKKIRSTDFENEELEKLKSLMQAAEDLQVIETNKSQTEKQLIELERKKKLMELSVKKAGLVLFYKNQIDRYDPIIHQKIIDDKELKLAVKESIEARQRLISLNEEIKSDENVDLIQNILNKQDPYHEHKSTDPIILAFDLISKSLTKLMRI